MVSPRSLLMGHQLRREHYFLLERLDKLEKILALKQAAQPPTHEHVERAVRAILAVEHGDKLSDMLERQSILQSELAEVRRSNLTASVDILKRIENLESHRHLLDQQRELIEGKAGVVELTDCNRAVQTLMTLVQQNARDLSNLLDRMDAFDAQLTDSLRKQTDAAKLVSSLSPLSAVVPELSLPRLLSLTREGKFEGPTSRRSSIHDWESIRINTTASHHALRPQASSPAPPSISSLTVSVTQPLQSIVRQADMEEVMTQASKRHEGQQKQYLTIETQRLTRSHRGLPEQATLAAPLSDPDSVLRKPAAKTLRKAKKARKRTSTRIVGGGSTGSEAQVALAGDVQVNQLIKDNPLVAHMRAYSRMEKSTDWSAVHYSSD